MALGPFYVKNKLKGGNGMRGIALFMRHGETPWNREGRVMGRNPVELDAEGRAQVEASVPFARLLKPELIITSPLARARQSAEIIAAGVGGVPIAEDPQLSEVQYGRWEGWCATICSRTPSTRTIATIRWTSRRPAARRSRRCNREASRQCGAQSARTAGGASCSSRTATSSAPCCVISCGSSSPTSGESGWTTRRSPVFS